MKTLLLSSLMLLTSQAFAAKYVAQDCHPSISDVTHETVVDQEGSSCGVEDVDCGLHPYRPTTYKDVVIVEVSCEDKFDHIDQVEYVGARFKEQLDASQFSARELKSLTVTDYQARLKAAHQLLDLQITKAKHKDYSSSMTFLNVEVIRK